MRSEQEEASSEVVEIVPGVLRLQLPIHFTGLGHVNTYVLEDGEGVAVVDPGLPGEDSWRALEARLGDAGFPVGRVHTVIITHSHPDHFGGAGLLAERAGARIVASEHFRVWWQADEGDDAELESATSVLNQPTPWGGTVLGDLTEEQRARIEQMRASAAPWFRTPTVTHSLADADHIELGRREWVALFTPGHTTDHLCLFDPVSGVLLSGDHVLPTITPHISGLLPGDPLASYVESLERVATLEGVTTVLPAHGRAFDDLVGRIDAIKHHHHERLAQLRAASAEVGWASVEQLSQRLFSPRSWGSMAESETYAHLEHLRASGEADRREISGRLEFLVS